jgi:hypothetical protein
MCDCPKVGGHFQQKLFEKFERPEVGVIGHFLASSAPLPRRG